MFNKKFPAITQYPLSLEDYTAREKAYSSNWQIRFFFIGILAATTFFMPEIIAGYILKISLDHYLLQGIGLILALLVMLLSRKSRRTLARQYGLYCPQCGEIFDYWYDKKNSIKFGGYCPKCNYKIININDDTDKEKE